ncbi:MAG: c-type cytochrome domain-containing protein, partial [Planctomycetota bacterium]
MKSLLLASALLSTCGLDVSPGGAAGGTGTPPGATVFFSFDVLPVFQQDCIHCHGGAGGLNLESYEGLTAGGFSGPVVVPFDPD